MGAIIQSINTNRREPQYGADQASPYMGFQGHPFPASATPVFEGQQRTINTQAQQAFQPFLAADPK